MSCRVEVEALMKALDDYIEAVIVERAPHADCADSVRRSELRKDLAAQVERLQEVRQ